MGGSLSAQPLSHAIYCYWTGEDEASAARTIEHDRGDDPYQDLSIMSSRSKVQSGEEVLLYFAPEPYNTEVTRGELEETYEFVPIARDALVFLTNVQNPVRNVSSQDMTKVYGGQIVNWSELGGKNATVKAFQRPWFSYSQQMLENTLMLGKSMAEPIVHWIQAEEGGQEYFETNSAYDNSEFALGYTMYYYANGMYGSEETNILAIDSVVPNQHTIAAGLYPLITTYYAIFPKNAPEDHPVRALVSWLCTDEGQQVIRNAGYIPLREQDAEPQARQAPFSVESTRQSCGTGGMQDRQNEPRVYSKECLRGIGSMVNFGNRLAWEEVLIDLPDSPVMMETIAAWQRNAKEELRSATEDDEQAIEEYVLIYGNLISFFESTGFGTDTVIRTAVFDLKTGFQLQLSDLFLDGFNYIQYINRFLLESSMQEGGEALGDFSIEEQNLNGPFSGLPAGYPYFIVSQKGELCLAFPGNNPLIQVPYDNVFFSAIPLWHNISPWGGYEIEQSFNVIENQDPKAFFYQPSLLIDGGQQSAAVQTIQKMEQESAETFTEMVDKQGQPFYSDDPIICLPKLFMIVGIVSASMRMSLKLWIIAQ